MRINNNTDRKCHFGQWRHGMARLRPDRGQGGRFAAWMRVKYTQLVDPPLLALLYDRGYRRRGVNQDPSISAIEF